MTLTYCKNSSCNVKKFKHLTTLTTFWHWQMNFQVYWLHQGCKYYKNDIISEDIFSFGEILKKVWNHYKSLHRVFRGKIISEIMPSLTSVFKSQQHSSQYLSSSDLTWPLILFMYKWSFQFEWKCMTARLNERKSKQAKKE